MYFTSNHDENSWNGTEFEQLGDAYEAFAVLTQTLYGMPLIYSGQEEGFNQRLAFFDKDEIIWNEFSYEDFYTTFNNLRDTCSALWHGEKGGAPVIIETNAVNAIFAYSRSKNNSRVVVLLNLSPTKVTFNITDTTYNSEYTDLFSGSRVNLSTDNAKTLDSWEYQVLVK